LSIVHAGVLAGVLAACGGPQVPAHNGYKPKEVAPWKKPKALKFNDKNEAKADGEVSYPDMRRARWFELTLPSNGQLSLALEITPPGDAINDDFDLGLEVFDPQNRSISRSDLEAEDAHELTKKKTLVDLAPGKYLVHVFLQGRMDTADFVLQAAFKPTAAAEVKSNFPSEVKFVPTLAMVPIQDDTPRSKIPPPPPPHGGTRPPRNNPTPTPAKPEPGPGPVKARVIGMSITAKGTQIIVSRGTTTGAANGMNLSMTGVTGTFKIESCREQTCTAVVAATPDQIRAANSMVTLTP
jgi:hypothetical protein